MPEDRDWLTCTKLVCLTFNCLLCGRCSLWALMLTQSSQTLCPFTKKIYPHAASPDFIVLDFAPSNPLATGQHSSCILTMSYVYNHTKEMSSAPLKDLPIGWMSPPLSFRTLLSEASVTQNSNCN